MRGAERNPVVSQNLEVAEFAIAPAGGESADDYEARIGTAPSSDDTTAIRRSYNRPQA